MWHRRQRGTTSAERAGSDPQVSTIWETGHLTGAGSEPPVIKAPRAADLAASDAA